MTTLEASSSLPRSRAPPQRRCDGTTQQGKAVALWSGVVRHVALAKVMDRKDAGAPASSIAAAQAVPEGFEPLVNASVYSRHIGPSYARKEADGMTMIQPTLPHMCNRVPRCRIVRVAARHPGRGAAPRPQPRLPARPARAGRQAAAVLFGDDLPAAESVARSPCRRAVRDGTPDRAAALRLNRFGDLERLRLRRLRHRRPSATDHPAMAA